MNSDSNSRMSFNRLTTGVLTPELESFFISEGRRNKDRNLV